MDYNALRSRLILPEYGRNIQMMVEYAKNIEDEQERTRAANAIITIMGSMNPHLRDINDFKHKLWDHLAIMSNFGLNIETPYPLPSLEELHEKPEIVPYPTHNIKYRHYGHIIELMIDKIKTLEEGSEKENLIAVISNHMKKSYTTWNNKDLVNDEIIYKNMEELSEGSITANGAKNSEPRENNNREKRKRTKRVEEVDYRKHKHR